MEYVEETKTHQVKIHKDNFRNVGMATVHWPKSPTVTASPDDYLDATITIVKKVPACKMTEESFVDLCRDIAEASAKNEDNFYGDVKEKWLHKLFGA